VVNKARVCQVAPESSVRICAAQGSKPPICCLETCARRWKIKSGDPGECCGDSARGSRTKRGQQPPSGPVAEEAIGQIGEFALSTRRTHAASAPSVIIYGIELCARNARQAAFCTEPSVPVWRTLRCLLTEPKLPATPYTGAEVSYISTKATPVEFPAPPTSTVYDPAGSVTTNAESADWLEIG